MCSKMLRRSVRVFCFGSPVLPARRDELCASLEPFGLLRKTRGAAPRLPTRPLPPTCTLEHVAVCEALSRWGGNQLSLRVRELRVNEEYVLVATSLLQRHMTATAVIECHAEGPLHAGSEAGDANYAKRRSEEELQALRTALRSHGRYPLLTRRRVRYRAWGLSFAAQIGGLRGVGSEIYITLRDGQELPPRPLCYGACPPRRSTPMSSHASHAR